MECCSSTVRKESLSDSVGQTKEDYLINYWLNQDPMLFTLNESVDDATKRYEESAEDSNQIDKLFFKNRDSPFMSDVKKQLTQIRGSLTNRQPTMEAVEKGKKDLLELMYKLDEGSEGVERTKV